MNMNQQDQSNIIQQIHKARAYSSKTRDVTSINDDVA